MDEQAVAQLNNRTLLSSKKDQMRTRAAPWMNPKDIMQSQRGHSQKVTYWTIPFIWQSQREETTVMDKKSG